MRCCIRRCVCAGQHGGRKNEVTIHITSVVGQAIFFEREREEIEGEVTQNSQSSCAQEEHCPSHLTGRACRHSSLPVRKAWDHPLLLKCPSRAVRARKRVQQHKPTTSSTCEAMPRALDPEATQEVPGLWRKRDLSETVPFRLRIGHRLHQRGRRVGPCLGHPPTEDNAVPFGAVPLSGLLHTRSRFEAWPHLFGSADTRASCPLQLELLGKEATHPPPPQAWCRTG